MIINFIIVLIHSSFSQKSEQQQVSSGLQDSSQYSSWSW